MADTVAIKTADGSFYILFNVNFRGKKRMVLTTERDEQDEISIEFYRSKGVDMLNPKLMEIITLENLPKLERGELDVNLTVELSDEQVCEIHAEIEGTGISSGKSLDLKRSSQPTDITALERTEHETAEGEDIEEPAAAGTTEAGGEPIQPIDEDFVLGIDPNISYDRETVRAERRVKRRKRAVKKMYLPMIILYLLVGAGALILLAFFIFLGIQVPPLPVLEG